MNTMSSQKRKYDLKARARQHDETRQRIVEATSYLHNEVGPARTTVAEIARRAGVQRLTVYNHFPDETELYEACGAHWMSQNPIPDLSVAFAMGDPAARMRTVLTAFYGWYRGTAKSQELMQRDRLALPAFDAVVKVRVDQQVAGLAHVLAAGIQSSDARVRPVHATVALALDFWTWRRLAGEGMADQDAADLMVGAVEAAAGT